MTREDFEQSIAENRCPFCGKAFKYYDGALGYEALKCEDCKVSVDVDGIHLD